MSTTELTTQKSLLEQAIIESSGRRFPTIPTIGMVNNMSSVEGMEKGEFYIRKTVEIDAGFTSEYESIGTEPEVILLLRRFTYSRYSKTEDKIIQWTNEFAGFTDKDIVFLKNSQEGSPIIECELPYPEFKKYIAERYVNDEGRNKLKFRNVFYVLYPASEAGELHRMFVSNASIAGIEEGADSGDFRKPQPGSFLQFERTLRAPEPQAYFHRILRLGSKEVSGKDFLLMTFEDAGRSSENMMTFVEKWDYVRNLVESMTQSQFVRAKSGRDSVVAEVVDDLPFE